LQFVAVPCYFAGDAALCVLFDYQYISPTSPEPAIHVFTLWTRVLITSKVVKQYKPRCAPLIVIVGVPESPLIVIVGVPESVHRSQFCLLFSSDVSKESI